MKNIVIKASVKGNVTNRGLSRSIKEVKTKDTTVGNSGVLSTGLRFLISKTAFIIF